MRTSDLWNRITWRVGAVLLPQLMMAAPAFADTVNVPAISVRVCVGKSKKAMALTVRADDQYVINGRTSGLSTFTVKGGSGATSLTGDADTTEVIGNGLRVGTDTYSVSWVRGGTTYATQITVHSVACPKGRLRGAGAGLGRAAEIARAPGGAHDKKQRIQNNLERAIQSARDASATPGLTAAQKQQIDDLLAKIRELRQRLAKTDAREIDHNALDAELQRLLEELSGITGQYPDED
jgi:hypothetical protein